MPMKRDIRTYAGLLLLMLALLWPAAALAHGGHVGPTQIFTQAVGPYELTVTIEVPQAAPAPLYLIVTPPPDIGDATIALRAAPRGQSFANAAVAEVRTNPPQPSYNTQLQVDRAGDWELEAQVAGPRGSGMARIPFAIAVAPMSSTTVVLLAAIGTLIALMILNIALEGVARMRGRKLPVWATQAIGYALFACVIVGVIFGVQQFRDSIQSAQAAQAGSLGRPHVNVALSTDPGAPLAGKPLALTLDLSDGSTGLPIDDLVPHHEALMHLVVIDESGAFFAHIHPGRQAAGRFTVALTPDRPGRYTAYAEVERQDSGVQVIARDFEVGGAAVAAAAPAPGLGEREIGNLRVNVSSSIAPLRAGRQATLTFSLSGADGPLHDLQLWLGMPGHLIARSADGMILGHIHAAEQLPPVEMIDSVRYGPDIRFVYTFPRPGRYQLWGQFQRNGAIVTVPLTVEVDP
jgi:hypothetical protein